MFRTSIHGPRAAALFIGCLIAVGVFAAGPAVGADQAEVVRVIVQLDDAALAKYRDTLPGLKGVLNARTAEGHVDVKAPASTRVPRAPRPASTTTSRRRSDDAAPTADVQWDYDTALQRHDDRGVRATGSTRSGSCPTSSPSRRRTSSSPSSTRARTCSASRQLWQSLPSSPLGAGAGTRASR